MRRMSSHETSELPLLSAESALDSASGRQTVEALVNSAGRKGRATPIRRSFVQPLERDRQPEGGPLAKLVRHRDHRALLLYLVVLTLAAKEPWDVRRHSKIWARVLDVSENVSGRQAVSKAWRRLRDLDLVAAQRQNRLSSVTVLHEDGSGRPYEYPNPRKSGDDRYLRLPFAFWLEGWYQRLTVPGLAILLVLLAEKDGVLIPLDRFPDWYGISRSTAHRGITELETNELLSIVRTRRVEPLAPDGYTVDRHLILAGAFSKAQADNDPQRPGGPPPASVPLSGGE